MSPCLSKIWIFHGPVFQYKGLKFNEKFRKLIDFQDRSTYQLIEELRHRQQNLPSNGYMYFCYGYMNMKYFEDLSAKMKDSISEKSWKYRKIA